MEVFEFEFVAYEDPIVTIIQGGTRIRVQRQQVLQAEQLGVPLSLVPPKMLDEATPEERRRNLEAHERLLGYWVAQAQHALEDYRRCWDGLRSSEPSAIIAIGRRGKRRRMRVGGLNGEGCTNVSNTTASVDPSAQTAPGVSQDCG